MAEAGNVQRLTVYGADFGCWKICEWRTVRLKEQGFRGNCSTRDCDLQESTRARIGTYYGTSGPW